LLAALTGVVIKQQEVVYRPAGSGSGTPEYAFAQAGVPCKVADVTHQEAERSNTLAEAGFIRAEDYFAKAEDIPDMAERSISRTMVGL
jgi:hypothetical protein